MTIQRHPRHQARIDDERARWARRAAIDAARTTDDELEQQLLDVRAQLAERLAELDARLDKRMHE